MQRLTKVSRSTTRLSPALGTGKTAEAVSSASLLLSSSSASDSSEPLEISCLMLSASLSRSIHLSFFSSFSFSSFFASSSLIASSSSPSSSSSSSSSSESQPAPKKSSPSPSCFTAAFSGLPGDACGEASEATGAASLSLATLPLLTRLSSILTISVFGSSFEASIFASSLEASRFALSSKYASMASFRSSIRAKAVPNLVIVVVIVNASSVKHWHCKTVESCHAWPSI
mmetsp:Transcript_11320/g.20086  ORF Transcript_11320/g.20086 Transcript_11320/m.20086 type:complete len:229 (+) Transcript_11320:409-1095(+)